ncbi:MAG: DNA alkylation repair protein [Alloprevotella sp.]|nr:DNA alkylation repair protein [Alloprevotella sp.]
MENITSEAIDRRLHMLAEPDYAAFSAKLIPNLNRPLLGVRIPQLRQLAKALLRENPDVATGEAFTHLSHENIALHGFVLGYARMDYALWEPRVAQLVPLLDNWALCDMTCASLTLIRRHRSEGWRFLQSYLRSNDEFGQRFGVVMLMDHFLTDEWADRVLEAFVLVRPAGYYAAMAVGWALQAAFIRWPRRVFPLLSKAQVCEESRKMARKKLLESRRTPNEWRMRIKILEI